MFQFKPVTQQETLLMARSKEYSTMYAEKLTKISEEGGDIIRRPTPDKNYFTIDFVVGLSCVV